MTPHEIMHVSVLAIQLFLLVFHIRLLYDAEQEENRRACDDDLFKDKDFQDSINEVVQERINNLKTKMD